MPPIDSGGSSKLLWPGRGRFMQKAKKARLSEESGSRERRYSHGVIMMMGILPDFNEKRSCVLFVECLWNMSVIVFISG